MIDHVAIWTDDLERPRRTGDGYYESIVRDPDGNLVELTV